MNLGPELLRRILYLAAAFEKIPKRTLSKFKHDEEVSAMMRSRERLHQVGMLKVICMEVSDPFINGVALTPSFVKDFARKAVDLKVDIYQYELCNEAKSELTCFS